MRKMIKFVLAVTLAIGALSAIAPVSMADGSDPMPLCRPPKKPMCGQ